LAWAVKTIAVAVAVVVAFTIVYRHIARPPIIAGLLLYYAALYGTLYVSCRAFSTRHGSGSLATDYGVDLRARDSYRGLGVYLLANIASAIAVAPFLHTSRFQGTNTQSLTDYRHDAGVFFVLVLVAVVAAPFFEELFFRGLLFRALLGRMRPAWAVLVQGVVFGSAHYNPYMGTHNVTVIVAVAAMGVVLGWSALHFRRLGPGMIAHFLKNLTAVLAVVAT
jgi:membrane protease YdiL (CAAX protease family)